MQEALECTKYLFIYAEQVRIQADVQVLELDETGLAPYTFDYTIRLEERRAFVEEIAHYRYILFSLPYASPILILFIIP